VFDLDSRALAETARMIRDEGRLPHGAAVAGRPAFFLGAADMPIDPPPGWRPDALAAKIDAGAQFLQTQFCMDAAIVRRYAARLAEAGLTGRVSILVGVTPLRSAKSAAWMRQHLFGTIIPDAMVACMQAAADPVAEGRRICVELIAELATIPGVAGVHVMAPGNAAGIPEVIAAARARLGGAANTARE
jgi:methylenetetrahydrofolate reductase (NADPH)